MIEPGRVLGSTHFYKKHTSHVPAQCHANSCRRLQAQVRFHFTTFLTIIQWSRDWVSVSITLKSESDSYLLTYNTANRLETNRKLQNVLTFNVGLSTALCTVGLTQKTTK